MNRKNIYHLLTIICLGLSSCSLFESDESVVRTKFVEFVENIQNKNNQKIKEMFSKNVCSSSLVLDDNISSLLEYYDGNYNNIEKNGGSYTDELFHSGKVSKTIRMGFKLYSSEENFYFCFDWCIKDDFNDKNIGIKSMYVIKESEINNPNSSYGGDGSFSDGLFIGFNQMIDYIEVFNDYVFRKNSSSLKQLFSKTCLVNAVSIDTDINKLFTILDSTTEFDLRNFKIIYKTSADQKTVQYYELYRTLIFDGYDYSFVSKMILKDTTNSLNEGLESIYIKKCNLEDSIENTNWTDGFWAYGINIIE